MNHAAPSGPADRRGRIAWSANLPTLAVLAGLACAAAIHPACVNAAPLAAGKATSGGVGPMLPNAAQCGAPIADGSFACSIDPSLDSLALCNDGTIPAFWYRPGYGSGLTKWVIWLEGGGDCYDQVSCASRAAEGSLSAQYTTSNGFIAASGNGVLSPDQQENPRLYDANTVLLHYCSSDTWTGNQPAAGRFDANNPATWNFQGRRIALAAVASLRAFIPTYAAATWVLIGGTSAGGEGIAAIANDLLPSLPPGATLLLADDAGFGLNIGQYDRQEPAPYAYSGQPNAAETNTGLRLALWNGRGDAVCDAAAQTPQQHQNCYNSGYVLQNGFIKIPSFVAESQLDTAQLTAQLCPQLYGKCRVPHNPASAVGTYATYFATQMAVAIAAAGTPASYTGYAPDKYMHVILTDESLFITRQKFAGGGISPRTAFYTWLSNPTGPRVVDIGSGPGVQ